MTIIYICLILAASIVYVWDYVNFPRNFLARLYSIIFKQNISPEYVKLPYLLQCSLCAVTWSTLILLLIFNWKLAPLCLVFGWSTKYFLKIFDLVDKIFDISIKIIDFILEKIKKILK